MRSPDKLHHTVETIEWTEDANPELMMWNYPLDDREIRYGAKLLVREFQQCIFFDRDKILSVFQPGIYTLTGDNMPGILNSARLDVKEEFRPHIYFWKTKFFIDQKWCAPDLIQPDEINSGGVKLKVFGTCDLKITDVVTCIRHVGHMNDGLTTREINDQVGKLIQHLFPIKIKEQKLLVMEETNQQNEIVEAIQQAVNTELKRAGVSISKLTIKISEKN